MDKLDRYTVNFMRHMGNIKANDIWVARYSNKQKSRPHRSSNREMRELWIRQKYEHKKFLRPDSAKVESKEELNQAMYQAIASNKLQDAMQALAKGADIDWANPGQELRTPLHQAVHLGHLEIVEMLCQNGAQLEPALQDARGWTPLHYAAYHGHAPSVELLLLRGAARSQILVKDRNELTPLDLHLRYNDSAGEACRMLQFAEAKEKKRASALSES